MIVTKDLIDILSFGVIGSECNQVILEYKSRNLHCQFVANDRTMFGVVMYEKYNDGNSFFGNEPIAIADVSGLIKMLKTLGKEINTNLLVAGRGERYLVISDGALEMRVPLIRHSQVPTIPRLKSEQLLDAKRQAAFMTDGFIPQFYKLSGALKDCKYVFFNRDDGAMQIYISDSEDYNNGVKIELESDITANIFNITKFDMKKVRTLLYNNRRCEHGKITVDSGLLLTLQFIHKNCRVFMHIVAE